MANNKKETKIENLVNKIGKGIEVTKIYRTYSNKLIMIKVKSIQKISEDVKSSSVRQMTKTNCDDVAIGFENDSSALIFVRYVFVGIFRFDDANNLQSTLSRKRKNLIKTYQKSAYCNNKYSHHQILSPLPQQFSQFKPR